MLSDREIVDQMCKDYGMAMLSWRDPFNPEIDYAGIEKRQKYGYNEDTMPNHDNAIECNEK